MQTIYVVVRFREGWDGSYIVAAFTTKDKAEAHIQKMVKHDPYGEYQVEEADMFE